MAPHAIVSYDDTQNDHDALALGRTLRDAGAHLMLAYVRHCTHRRPDDEELSQHEAEALLVRGALSLDDQSIERRVVLSASTGEGLGWLAAQERADIVVFGSEYRTAPGHVAPQRSTQAMLEGGTSAVAIAPAGYHDEWAPKIHRIGVLAIPGDDSTLATARSLADSYGATLTRDEHQVDLLVVGSRLEAAPGRVLISAQAQNEIENATRPVLVMPHGVTLDFPAVLAHAA